MYSGVLPPPAEEAPSFLNLRPPCLCQGQDRKCFRMLRNPVPGIQYITVPVSFNAENVPKHHFFRQKRHFFQHVQICCTSFAGKSPPKTHDDGFPAAFSQKNDSQDRIRIPFGRPGIRTGRTNRQGKTGFVCGPPGRRKPGRAFPVSFFRRIEDVVPGGQEKYAVCSFLGFVAVFKLSGLSAHDRRPTE